MYVYMQVNVLVEALPMNAVLRVEGHGKATTEVD